MLHDSIFLDQKKEIDALLKKANKKFLKKFTHLDGKVVSFEGSDPMYIMFARLQAQINKSIQRAKKRHLLHILFERENLKKLSEDIFFERKGLQNQILRLEKILKNNGIDSSSMTVEEAADCYTGRPFFD